MCFDEEFAKSENVFYLSSYVIHPYIHRREKQTMKKGKKLWQKYSCHYFAFSFVSSSCPLSSLFVTLDNNAAVRHTLLSTLV